MLPVYEPVQVELEVAVVVVVVAVVPVGVTGSLLPTLQALSKAAVATAVKAKGSLPKKPSLNLFSHAMIYFLQYFF